MDHQQFKAGDLILKQGDISSNAYRIVKGQVEVFLMREGERVILGQLGEGEIFGEMGMIDDKPRAASVQAVGPTEVEVITPKVFNEVILHTPDQIVPYLRSFFERLRRATQLFPPALPAAPCKESVAVSPSALSVNEVGAVQLVAKTETLCQKVSKASLTVRKFPFRIGRWSENFKSDVFISNDLVIRDEAPFQVSRNHCAIEREGNRYSILDRGSALGTSVNGKRIGGVESQMIAPLHSGENEVCLGSDNSPYQFRVIIS